MVKHTSLDEAIGEVYGPNTRMVKRERVHGGDINDAYRHVLSNGESVFVKMNSLSNVSFFEAEVAGLKALKASGAIGVPEILAYGEDRAKGISFLMLEFLYGAPRGRDYWEIFGHELAALHKWDAGRTSPECQYGFPRDNFIGASVQKNAYRSSWVSFYRECRLEVQIRMAERYFDSAALGRIGRLLDGLSEYITEPDFPSLLHGDLWGGNVICGNDGKAWLIDPAVYVGHYETDIAMTRLFGGFPKDFYDAYHEVMPIEPGYNERIELYQLYHLLNHLNLFGRGYLGEVLRILGRFT